MIAPGSRTLYELVAENGDERILLAYCSNRSRRTLLECCRKHAGHLIAMTGDEGVNWAKRAGDGATMGTWHIRWTGRTQREAQDSKLPWIGDRQ